MDRDLLETCSQTVQRAVEYVYNIQEEKEQIKPRCGPALFLLSKFGETDLSKFNAMFSEDQLTHYPDINTYIMYEGMKRYPFALKYANSLDPISLSNHEEVVSMTEYIKRNQTVEGKVRSNDWDHTGPMWSLIICDPESNSTQNAVDYFLKNWRDTQIRPDYLYGDLAAGVLALSEYDYYQYKEDISTITDYIANLINTAIQKDHLGKDKVGAIALNAMALARSPNSYTHLLNTLIRKIRSWQYEEGYWEFSEVTIPTAIVALGLIYNGEGPKTPIHEKEWKRELQVQKRNRIKPQFVSTFPAQASASHTTEIHDRSKALIQSTQEELRIMTQYIDMLYEDIIDLSKSNSNVEVKILTRGKSVSGNRQRIKKAVLDELIEATDGNVRGNHRMHSRVIISDREAMVVSSADLTRDQLHDQFNAGIYTKDSGSIQKAIEFFEDVWEESDHVNHS